MLKLRLVHSTCMLFYDVLLFLLQVTIRVTDANDNSPVCPRLPRMELDRTTAVGTVVTILEVTDADIGENAEIVFQGIRGEFVPQFLNVDPQTGAITTIRSDSKNLSELVIY